MIRKIIDKLFWHYQENENWKMKMNEPIAIRKLTKEEAKKWAEDHLNTDEYIRAFGEPEE